MAKNEEVAYKNYVIFPMALYLPNEKKWQPFAVITRETDEGLTLPRSQSFPHLPVTFDEEETAIDFAVQYGQQLIDRKRHGLTI